MAKVNDYVREIPFPDRDKLMALGNSINLDTTVITGIFCRECGAELPPHTGREHLQKDHPIHVCPHSLEEE